MSRIFPLLDYLYIFQLLEYDRTGLLKWFFKNPLRRNLQKKNSLDFTLKIQLLAFLTSFIMLALATLTTLLFFDGSLLALILTYILFEALSPFFIIISSIILAPLDFYLKMRIVSKARKKLSTLSQLKTVAIIGSFAKTSTKNMLYTLLWKDFYVVKTPKSFNTPVAIAKTILLDLKKATQVFIVEMDAYHRGDIRNLCKIAQPDMAVITAIAPQHLERFGNIKKLAETQFEVSSKLKENGLLFLNSQDELTIQTEEKYNAKKVFYGGELDKFKIEKITQTGTGLNFKLLLDKESVNIELPLQGEHNAYNFLAAATIAYKLGLPAKKIKERARLILPTEHRLEVKVSGDITVIDNSYNTNPTVVISSLKLLKEEGKNKHKILITPGLIEQGENSDYENRKFIRQAARVADEIIIVGESFKTSLKEGLKEAEYPSSKIHFAPSTKSAVEKAGKIGMQNKVILIENDLPDQYA
jgi:UDP-N-acetylmuramoyl-tripeptide--D-alanyl-D-alanine ligase